METAYIPSTSDVSKTWFGTHNDKGVNGDNLPIRNGYRFTGWKITSGGGTFVDSTWTSSKNGTIHDYVYNSDYAGNVTITAQWTALPKITVDPNGGKMWYYNYSSNKKEETTSSKSITYYPNNTAKREFLGVGLWIQGMSQYASMGWTRTGDCKTPYLSGKTFKGLKVTEGNGTAKTYSASDLAITGSNTSKTTSDGKITVKNNSNEGYTYYYNVANSTGNITIKVLWN